MFEMSTAVTTWKLTGHLRQFAESIMAPLRLQQEWECQENGAREWKDVPIAYERGSPVSDAIDAALAEPRGEG